MTDKPGNDNDILVQLKTAVAEMTECRSKMVEARASEVLIESLAKSSISNVRDAELPDIVRLEDPDYKAMSRHYLARQEAVSDCFARTERAVHLLHRVAIRHREIDNETVQRLSARDIAFDPNKIELLLEYLKSATSFIEKTKVGGGKERAVRRRRPSRDSKVDAIRRQAEKLRNENTVDGKPPSVQELCRLFDAKKVPLPPNVSWTGEGFWTGAYKKEQYRQAVRLWVNRLR